MEDRNAPAWHAQAAYLYVLSLDGPSLAWEYLRRNPDYRLDWLRRPRRPEAARVWGLRLWEDPARDARDAHPAWFPDPDGVVQLHPDADSQPQSIAFEFWHIPGHRQLVHDGHRLLLLTRRAGACLRLALAPGLEDGMAYVYAVPAAPAPWARLRTAATVLEALETAEPAHPRPSSTALQELHTLQALDATLAGASLRDIACGLYGASVVDAEWHADTDLRSRVRRMVRRGQALMRGGYRRLAHIDLAG